MDTFLTLMTEAIKPSNILDIAIIAFLFYEVYMLVKGTRAIQLIKGILLLLLLNIISDVLGLVTVNWLLINIQTILIVAIPIIFQPELRKALEKLGTGSFWNIFKSDDTEEKDQEVVVNAVVKSMVKASKEKIGMLIVLKRETQLGEYTTTGVEIDAKVSSALITNIFVPNTPLHDGAVIIENNRIIAASCYLPLSDSTKISKDLGTRHRAAIGLTENTDALVLVVSEETGAMSLADGGILIRDINETKLKELILRKIKKEQAPVGKIWDKWGKKNEKV